MINEELDGGAGVIDCGVHEVSRNREETSFAPIGEGWIKPYLSQGVAEYRAHSLTDPETPMCLGSLLKQLDADRGAILAEIFANKLAGGVNNE